jgi:hypothetical protein
MTGCLVVKFPPPDRKEVNLMFVLGHYWGGRVNVVLGDA